MQSWNTYRSVQEIPVAMTAATNHTKQNFVSGHTPDYEIHLINGRDFDVRNRILEHSATFKSSSMKLNFIPGSTGCRRSLNIQLYQFIFSAFPAGNAVSSRNIWILWNISPAKKLLINLIIHFGHRRLQNTVKYSVRIIYTMQCNPIQQQFV